MFDVHGIILAHLKWEKSDLALSGPKTHQLIKWHTFEEPKWFGRNWRRIKRERRKFIDKAT